MKNLSDVYYPNCLVLAGHASGMPMYIARFDYIQDPHYRRYLESEAERFVNKMIRLQIQIKKD